MNRATIADIAARAGVSTATVDRVLHGRAGASAISRERVLSAARALGCLPMAGRTPLPARPVHLEFLLPLGRGAFMRDVAASITAFAAEQPLVASCRIVPLDGIDPHDLEGGLGRIAARTSGVGLVAVSCARTRAAVDALAGAGVRVVAIASDLPGTARSAYVGIDNRVAGRTAARLMGLLAGPAGGAVAIALGSDAFHGHLERERGFRGTLAARFPHLAILPPVETRESGAHARAALAPILRAAPPVGIYCIGAGRDGIVRAIHDHAGPRPRVVMHDLTDDTRAWLADGQIDVVIDQNPALVGRRSVMRLLGAIAVGTPSDGGPHIDPRIVFPENVPAGDAAT